MSRAQAFETVQGVEFGHVQGLLAVCGAQGMGQRSGFRALTWPWGV